MGCASSLPAVAEGDPEGVTSWRRCVVARRPMRSVSAACRPVGVRPKAPYRSRSEAVPLKVTSEELRQHIPAEVSGKAVFTTAASATSPELPRLSGVESETSDKSSTLGNSPGIGTGISDELSLLLPGSPIAHEAGLQEKSPTKGKERRLGFGIEAGREQLRRIAVGGPQTEADKASFYEISSSEDTDLEDEHLPVIGAPDEYLEKPAGVSDAIYNALRNNQVFKGIDQWRLQQMVDQMFGISFREGATIVQQGNQSTEDTDCMFFLEKGEVDVVISGNVEENLSNESRKREGNGVVIRKGPNWVFGDVALLFNTPRTASIISATPTTTWAMERKPFLQFVLRHAPAVRTLRFVRKFPLLKGLSDNVLLNVAQRMSEKTYNDGEAIIRFGEQGDQLFLIRNGKVRVLRPGGNEGERIEVACLGRGQFVGERTMVTGRLRSADCIASGNVRVVVINKKDFWELDNPMLSWMVDYDAVTCALKCFPQLQELTHMQLEQIIERFDSRKNINEGNIILREGQLVEKLYVVKTGELEVSKCGEVLTTSDCNFIREAGGFSFFGDEVLHNVKPSPVTIKVKSSTAQILTLPRSELDDFLGPVQDSLIQADIPSIVSVLEKVPILSRLANEKLEAIAKNIEVQVYDKGDVVVSPTKPSNSLLIVKTGHCLFTENGHASLVHGKNQIVRELHSGDYCGENSLMDTPTCSNNTLIMCNQRAEVMFLNRDTLELALGSSLRDVLKDDSKTKVYEPLIPKHLIPGIKFSDLEQHRIVGTGQFGLVRVVRHVPTDNAYALKVMHKAPITESKQVEHVVNERQILEEASHPFCVGLVSAFQDISSLYLLQEWVPGGELFHHLDLEGSFDEATAMFYAANVLLALEFLHSKGIVYRDLKPENLLLDLTGYIKVADFGFAKKIGKEPTFTICGTPDYQAPEVIMRRGTNKAADYWALGVLIFEMLVGDPPFKSVSGDPWDTFRRTLSGRFYVPNFISAEAADIIYKLLQVNPERRLGSGPGGVEDIKKHRWFAEMDWDALMDKKILAPVIPRVHNPLDTSNFDVFDGVDAPPHIPNERTRCEWGDSWEWVDTF